MSHERKHNIDALLSQSEQQKAESTFAELQEALPSGSGDIVRLSGDLFVQYIQTPILRYVIRRYPHGAARSAEDLVQETAVRFIENVRAGHLKTTSLLQLMAWCYRVVFNLISDIARYDKNHPTIPFHSQIGRPDDPADIDWLPDYIRAMDELSPEQRNIILTIESGFSPAELAQMLGISMETSYKRRNRARQALRKALDEPQARK
jgi:RNA polymerase sigma factor (sigma-70 family)